MAEELPGTSDVQLSFVIGEDGDVLELIKIDEEGNLYFRDNQDWTEVVGDEDAPTIFDQTLAEIDSAKVEEATAFFDSNEDIESDQLVDFT